MLVYAKSSKILCPSGNAFIANFLFTIIGGCLRFWKELVAVSDRFDWTGDLVDQTVDV